MSQIRNIKKKEIIRKIALVLSIKQQQVRKILKNWVRGRKLQFKQSQKHGGIWQGRRKVSYHLQRNNDLS